MSTDNDIKEVIIKPAAKTNIFHTFTDLWRSRHLVSYFSVRFIQQRYKGTFLGWGWLIIRPLLPAFLSTLIFGKMAKIPSDDVPYMLFFFTGFAIWNMFTTALVFMTRSIRNNRRLFTKLYFPRVIVPITSIAPVLIEFLVTFVMLFIIAAFYFIKEGRFYLNFSPGFFMAGYFVLMAILLIIGVGLWTAVLNAQNRDVRFGLPYFLQGWVFVTPVIYPISFVPQQWKWLVYLNPMTVIVEGYKWSILGKGEVNLAYGLLNVLIVILVFMSGIWFFQKAETAFVDSL